MGCCHSKEYSDNKVTRYDGPDRTKAPDAPKNPESRAEAPHYDSSAMMPTVTVTRAAVPDDFGKKTLGVMRLADAAGSYAPESIGQYRVCHATSARNTLCLGRSLRLLDI